MRVGISTSVIQRGHTGVGQYLFALLRAFIPHARQHHFTLFVLAEDLPLFAFAQDAMEIVPVPEKFRPPISDILWHQTRLPQLAGAHGLEVLHVPSYRRLLWPAPCARVATIHDLAPFHVRRKYDWKRMFYSRVLVRRLAHRQEEIIAISANTARDIERFFKVPASRVTVIHNGLDHERFQPGPHDVAVSQVAQRFDVRAPYFLYVARLEHPGKNHVRLIAAFDRFKTITGSKWQLVLGGSDWHGAEAIHAAIRHSPFAQDIHAIGFVPPDALPDLYRAAEAFVYPSLYEGFGMPPTEAMACGCPVICSTRGSLGEVVGDAAAIVEPEDIESIARGLTSVAADVSLRGGLRTAGLERARQFDWHITAAKTLKVYERALLRIRSTRNAEIPRCTTAAEPCSGTTEAQVRAGE